MDLTVCLLNWKRPANLHKVVNSLAAGLPRPKIFLWNNAALPYVNNSIDWQVDSSRNAGCGARWFMASQASTRYVCSLDDDLRPKSAETLVDAIAYLEANPKVAAIGPFGYGVDPSRSLYEKPAVNTPETDTRVESIKGRMIVARTADVASVAPCPAEWFDCDDLALSAALAKRGELVVPGLFRGAFEELPAPHSLVSRPNHCSRRSAFFDSIRAQHPSDKRVDVQAVRLP